MGRSRVSWAFGVVAPWCLGMGLVVSFTADAGHDTSIGASHALLSARRTAMPADLMSPSPIETARGAQRLRTQSFSAIHLAALAVGDPQDLQLGSDEVEPRRDLKRNVSAFPAPDRSRKGDPAVGLRPTFDAKLRQPGSLAAARFDDLLFNTRDYLAFSGFAARQSFGELADDEGAPAMGEYSSGATAPAVGARSPAQAGAAPFLVSPAPREDSRHDGASVAPLCLDRSVQLIEVR